MSLEAIQTPSSKELKEKGMSSVDHYANSIVVRKDTLRALSDYFVADGYFAKQGFVETITSETGFHVISKLRGDANLSVFIPWRT